MCWLYWILDNFFIDVIKPLRPQWGFISHGFVSLQMTGNCPWRSSSLTSPMVSSLMSRCGSCITPSTGSKQSTLIFLLKISQLQLKPLLLTCCLALKVNTSLQYFIAKPNSDVKMPVCRTEEFTHWGVQRKFVSTFTCAIALQLNRFKFPICICITNDK